MLRFISVACVLIALASKIQIHLMLRFIKMRNTKNYRINYSNTSHVKVYREKANIPPEKLQFKYISC